jgi:hypothetical protein
MSKKYIELISLMILVVFLTSGCVASQESQNIESVEDKLLEEYGQDFYELNLKLKKFIKDSLGEEPILIDYTIDKDANYFCFVYKTKIDSAYKAIIKLKNELELWSSTTSRPVINIEKHGGLAILKAYSPTSGKLQIWVDEEKDTVSIKIYGVS